MTTSTNLEDHFRQAMRRVAGTVCLVTGADHLQRRHGIAATSVVSVSMDPPSLLVCIHRDSSLVAAITHHNRFCVNVLAGDHEEICRPFGNPSEKHRRFDSGTWKSRHGLPYLEEAQSAVFCDVAQTITHGTHLIFLGNVTDVSAAQSIGQPLLYFNRQFATCENRLAV